MAAARPGRAGPDHGDIVGDGLRTGLDPQRVGELGVGRIDQDPAVEQHHHRQLLAGPTGPPQQRPTFIGVHRVEPEGNAVAA